MTILALDIGNSRTKCALVRPDPEGSAGGGVAVSPTGDWATEREATAEAIARALRATLSNASTDPSMLSEVRIASVVPPVEAAFEEAVRDATGRRPQFAGRPGLPFGLTLDVLNPSSVGADRVCNAVAALRSAARIAADAGLPGGGGAIVVSLGTATTFDWVDGSGTYRGGAIACGAGTAMRALAVAAARLPDVPIARPARPGVIGRTTVDQLTIGGWWGHLALIRTLIARMMKEIGDPPPVVIATGGHADAFAGEPDLFHHVDPHLTLRGLGALVADRHASESIE